MADETNEGVYLKPLLEELIRCVQEIKWRKERIRQIQGQLSDMTIPPGTYKIGAHFCKVDSDTNVTVMEDVIELE